MLTICDIAQFYSPLSGGVKRYIHDKRHYLTAHGDMRHVLVVPADRSAREDEAQGLVYRIRSPRLLGSASYRVLLNRPRLDRIVRDERPDLIEVGDPYQCAGWTAAFGRCYGARTVGYYHSDYPRALGRTLRRFGGPRLERIPAAMIKRYLLRVYNRLDLTVVSTRRVMNILRELGVRRVAYVPLGVDTEVFKLRDRQVSRAELGLRPEGPVLLFVGRLAREKNIDALLDMARRLAEGGRPITLALVGDGELRERVEQAARTHSARILRLPYCESARALSVWYSAADLFVHAGHCETFGLVSIEAQACGTRVIAVRGGGLDETLEGETPPIFAASPAGDAFVEAVRKALALREPETARARRRARIVERFDGARTYGELFRVYDNLCARGRVPFEGDGPA